MANRNEVFTLTEDDFKTRVFKAAPAGTYTFLISKKSKIKRFKNNVRGIELVLQIIGDSKGGKTKHVKINVFENLMPTVGWKIGQLLAALGIKKMKLTLEELLKLVVGKKIRGLVRIERFEKKDRNKIVQFLPLKPGADEEADDDVESDDEDEEEDDDESADSDDDSDEEDEDEDEDDDEDSDEEDDDEDSDDEDEDEDEDEEEEEEEGPAPKKKSVAKKAAPRPAAKKRR